MLSDVTITLTEYSGPMVPVRRPWWAFWQRQEPAEPYLAAKMRDDLILLRAGLNERQERLDSKGRKEAEGAVEKARQRGR
jgi:hypothetical protein